MIDYAWTRIVCAEVKLMSIHVWVKILIPSLEHVDTSFRAHATHIPAEVSV